MKKQNKNIFQRICIWGGIGLLVVAAAVMIIWQWSIHAAQKQAADYVSTLYSLLPEPQAAVPAERRDNTMSFLSLDGTDFVGILQMPRYGSTLPVGANWGQVSKYPCRFGGSIYDRTLQIGATTQAGQYDFYREISVGDTVLFTDMEGNCYTLTVKDLRYEKHADPAALQRKEAALILFIKNVYASEYLIVFCDVLQ